MENLDDKTLNLRISIPDPEDPSKKLELTGCAHTMVTKRQIYVAKKNWESLIANNTLDMTPFVKHGLVKKDSKSYFRLRDNMFALTYEYFHDTLKPNVDEVEIIDLYGVYFSWTIYIDDIYDTLRPENFPEGGIATIRKANKVWMNILMNRYGKDVQFSDLPQIKGFPVYEPFSRATIDMHHMFRKTAPEIYKFDEFWATLGHFFSGMEFKLGNQEACFKSENFFQNTQRMTCGAWNGFLLVDHLQGSQCPQELEHDALLNIVKITMGNIGTSISDLNGIGKDIAEGDKNNLVLFKAAFENWSMQEAFTYVVEFFNRNVREMEILINLLKEQYPTNMVVHKYLDGITSFIEKSIIWGAVCNRYHSADY